MLVRVPDMQSFPAFPDIMEEVRSSWDRPALAPSVLKQASQLASLEGAEKPGLAGFPPIDSTIVALVKAPPVEGWPKDPPLRPALGDPPVVLSPPFRRSTRRRCPSPRVAHSTPVRVPADTVTPGLSGKGPVREDDSSPSGPQVVLNPVPALTRPALGDPTSPGSPQSGKRHLLASGTGQVPAMGLAPEQDRWSTLWLSYAVVGTLQNGDRGRQFLLGSH
ncbi:UNVERIFIED_CONTAM: hypothetical protein FKN15_010305 [Acipenser sinensis]